MQYKRLSEIATSVQYGYTAQETSQQGVYKYLRITDIVPYYPNFETVPYCAIDNDEAQKYLLSEGDIVIARTGATTGYNFVVTKKIPPTVFASYLIRFRVDETQAYPKYIKYVLKSKPYYGFVANYVGGSAQPGMGAKVFARFPVPLPPLPTQRAIAEKLGRYDALIENNTRRIAILETKAEQLYKEWFVRRRFPGRSTTTSATLPPGWIVEKLGKLLDVKYGKDHKKLPDGDVPIFGSGGLMRYGNKALHDGEAVLIPRKGSLNNIMYFSGAFWTVDTMFYGVPRLPFLAKYLYMTLSKIDMASFNTGAALPSMTTDILNHMKVTLPASDILEAFDKKVSKLFALKVNLHRQNALLAKERDLLLPRLMSGRVKP